MPYYMHELNPDYNPATGMLRHMTTEELQMLLNDDEILETMVKELHQVKKAEAEREMLLTSNKSLAEYNLSKEPMLNEYRSKVVELYEELKSLKQSLESKKQKLDNLTRQMSLDTTQALIQAAAAESEEESEALSENFLSGEMPVDAFLESYLSKRKLTHLRRVKAEKMAELLNQSRAGSGRGFNQPASRVGPSVASNPPYPAPYTSFNPMIPPYPSGMPNQELPPYFR